MRNPRKRRVKRKAKKAATRPVIVRKPMPSVIGPAPVAKPKPRKTKAQTFAELAEAYQITFSSPLGEKVKADLMLWCNVYNPIDESDPIKLGMRMGERNVALRIAQMIGLRPEDFAYDAWADSSMVDQMMAA